MNKNNLIFYLLIFIGFLLRVSFILFAPYSGDEIGYVNVGMQNLFTNFDPNNFIHPSLYFYTLSFVYALFFIIGYFLHLFHTKIDFIIFFLKSPGVFLGLARLISIIFSLLTIYLVCRISRRWFSTLTTYLIVALMVVYYGDIYIAREASMYSMSTFMILLSWFYIYRLQKEINLKNLIIAAVVFGIALATDFYALLLIPVVIWAIITNNMQVSDKPFDTGFNNSSISGTISDQGRFSDFTLTNVTSRKIIFVFLGLALGIFIIINPYLLLNVRGLLRDLAFQFPTIFRADINKSYQALYYLNTFIEQGPEGVLLLLMLVIGSIYIILLKERDKYLFLIYPWLHLVIFSLFRNQAYRYIIHTTPFIFLISGNLFDTHFRSLKGAYKKLYYCLFIIVIILSLQKTIDSIWNKGNPSNFYSGQSESWVRSHIPGGSHLLLYGNTIPFVETRLRSVIYRDAYAEEILNQYYKRYPYEKNSYSLYPLDCTISKHNCYPEFIKANKIDYVVFSDRDEEMPLMNWVKRDGIFLKGFGPYDGQNKNTPFHIRIYDVRNIKPYISSDTDKSIHKSQEPHNNKIWHLIFLPPIIFIGIKTSYEDIVNSKIRNKWIVFGLLFSLLVYSLCWLIELSGRMTAIPAILDMIAHSLLYGFDKWCINLLASIAGAYLLWHFNMWGAGDAKLFICYSALIPVMHYSCPYGNSYLASLGLMKAVFLPAFCFFVVTLLFQRYISLKVSTLGHDLLRLYKGIIDLLKDKKSYLAFFGFFVLILYSLVIRSNLNKFYNILSWLNIVVAVVFLICFRIVTRFFLKYSSIVILAFAALCIYLFFNIQDNLYFVLNSFATSLTMTPIFIVIYFAGRALRQYLDSGDFGKSYPFAPWLFLGTLLVWFL